MVHIGYVHQITCNATNMKIAHLPKYSIQFAGKIVGSWFISPVLSGIMSTILFGCIRLFILNAKKPMNAALLSLPLIYGLTTFINVISIVMDGPKRNYFN